MKKIILANIVNTKWYFEHEDCPNCGSSNTFVCADGGHCNACGGWFYVER